MNTTLARLSRNIKVYSDWIEDLVTNGENMNDKALYRNLMGAKAALGSIQGNIKKLIEEKKIME